MQTSSDVEPLLPDSEKGSRTGEFSVVDEYNIIVVWKQL